MSGGFCLDAGALIALDRGQRAIVGLLAGTLDAGGSLEVPAAVVAQVWRDGARQARLARFLRARGVVMVDLDADAARAIGVMCGHVGVSDVVDGHVALHARRRGLAVLTSDPRDIARLDPSLVIVEV
ncbi:type II toxin-antitoxin system VapC family toxin [Nocardioides baculatus]|uniref:PIN domain-containing protein n=1 Tax=Nocardioides baculatus TaxID=2801337 RepID=A0ABS1LC47_9ACTN|nr:PIN domain-containing protein [Nocardioides baculatus]MBL0749260.1 PIN domain-containing protein [Nocardioides baculatus]